MEHSRRSGGRAGTADAAATGRGPCRRCGHPVTADDGPDCPGCGSPVPDGTDRVEFDLGALAGVSDRGLVHARNEDAMALGRHASGRIAVVVCDGVSSSPDPQLASRAATEATLDVLLDADPEESVTPRLVRSAVAAGARAVEALAGPGSGREGSGRGMPGRGGAQRTDSRADGPSCTLVAALIDRPPEPPDGTGPRIIVAWVGDSRAYWLAATRSRVLTIDHSWAEEIVAAGVLDAAAAALDRRAHAITRWLGAGGEPIPDLMTFVPDGPGVLLLCTDGLWNHLPTADELAAAALPRAVEDPAGAAADLTALALAAGGHDNITVVAVPVPAPRAGA